MSKVSLHITTKKLFVVQNWAISTGKVNNEGTFFESIGFSKGNSSKIKNGKINLTLAQIEALHKKYNININWLFDIDKNMLHEFKKIKATDLIRQGLIMLEKTSPQTMAQTKK